MSEIVDATGLSKGAFYHYFDSKEQLFVEVINAFYFNNMVVDYDKLSKTSLRDFYHDYIGLVRKVIADFNAGIGSSTIKPNINYVTMMFDALKLFPGFGEKMKEIQNKELDAWTTIIKTARKNGEFSSPMSDNQIARMFIYSSEGIGLHLLLNGDPSTAGNEMLALWDTFYKELKD